MGLKKITKKIVNTLGEGFEYDEPTSIREEEITHFLKRCASEGNGLHDNIREKDVHFFKSYAEAAKFNELNGADWNILPQEDVTSPQNLRLLNSLGITHYDKTGFVCCHIYDSEGVPVVLDVQSELYYGNQWTATILSAKRKIETRYSDRTSLHFGKLMPRIEWCAKTLVTVKRTDVFDNEYEQIFCLDDIRQFNARRR